MGGGVNGKGILSSIPALELGGVSHRLLAVQLLQLVIHDTFHLFMSFSVWRL